MQLGKIFGYPFAFGSRACIIFRRVSVSPRLFHYDGDPIQFKCPPPPPFLIPSLFSISSASQATARFNKTLLMPLVRDQDEEKKGQHFMKAHLHTSQQEPESILCWRWLSDNTRYRIKESLVLRCGLKCASLTRISMGFLIFILLSKYSVYFLFEQRFIIDIEFEVKNIAWKRHIYK